MIRQTRRTIRALFSLLTRARPRSNWVLNERKGGNQEEDNLNVSSTPKSREKYLRFSAMFLMHYKKISWRQNILDGQNERVTWSPACPSLNRSLTHEANDRATHPDSTQFLRSNRQNFSASIVSREMFYERKVRCRDEGEELFSCKYFFLAWVIKLSLTRWREKSVIWSIF